MGSVRVPYLSGRVWGLTMCTVHGGALQAIDTVFFLMMLVTMGCMWYYTMLSYTILSNKQGQGQASSLGNGISNSTASGFDRTVLIARFSWRTNSKCMLLGVKPGHVQINQSTVRLWVHHLSDRDVSRHHALKHPHH